MSVWKTSSLNSNHLSKLRLHYKNQLKGTQKDGPERKFNFLIIALNRAIKLNYTIFLLIDARKINSTRK